MLGFVVGLMRIVSLLPATASSQVVQRWVARYSGPADDKACCIARDLTSGHLYVTGRSYGVLSTNDAYATVAYDANGIQLWVARYDGPTSRGNERATAIAVDPHSGTVYVTGSSSS